MKHVLLMYHSYEVAQAEFTLQRHRNYRAKFSVPKFQMTFEGVCYHYRWARDEEDLCRLAGSRFDEVEYRGPVPEELRRRILFHVRKEEKPAPGG